jgi:hypothetical protein
MEEEPEENFRKEMTNVLAEELRKVKQNFLRLCED